jgi:hemin uptake protein HemP
MKSKTISNSELPAPDEQASLPLAPGPQPSLVYTTCNLFKGQSEIQIEHKGAKYRLRITKSGGLILNK